MNNNHASSGNSRCKPGDPLASLSPEAWRELLDGRLDDLDRLERAYTAVEMLVMPVGPGEESNTLSVLPRSYLYALLQTLNQVFGEVLQEAHQAYKRSRL